MKRAMSILYGATALVIAATGAIAQPVTMTMEDSSASAAAVYEVDDDRDGRVDRLLILEQSDSLA